MSNIKNTTLPHVLKEYNPNYSPKSTSSSSSKQKSSHDCQGHKSPGRGSKERPQSYVPPPSREDTSSSMKNTDKRSQQQENKRHERLSARWDQAKQEVRQEDHEALKEKIVLQQELIRKQAEYAEQRRHRQNQQENERKEAEKQKKLAKEQELKEICKKSLEEDKKAVKEEKRAKAKQKKDEVPQQSNPASPTKSPTTPTTPGGRRSNPFKMTLPTMSATPDIIDDSDDESKTEELVIPKDALWHEQQLYKLYGKSADYFLHPKIETKAQTKKSHPKLRRHGGRAGAEVLWQTLRHDSNARLMQEDASIPFDLKDAYGAFARQSLKKFRAPVRRMFCIDDDLPEMNRLLDNSKLQKIRKMRHKSDLMYRASVSNQDRTEVLTFNNPLPEFHDRTDSISQYLPSWQDGWSESTEPGYLHWVMRSSARNQKEATIDEEAEDGNQMIEETTRSMDDDLIFILSRKKQNQPKQKYIFLSEKDTKVKGEFSEKYKDDREYKDIPRPYQGDRPKPFSAMGGMVSATPDPKIDNMLRYSAPLPSRQHLLNNYTSGWQPLSMHALVEYKKQLSTIGDGDFNLGRTKMWSNIPVV